MKQNRRFVDNNWIFSFVINIFCQLEKMRLQAIPFFSIRTRTLSNILLRYVAGSMNISEHLKYNISPITLLNDPKQILIWIAWLCRSYRNGISKCRCYLLKPAARILRMYILNLCVCFSTNKNFSPLWYFSTVGKKQ